MSKISDKMRIGICILISSLMLTSCSMLDGEEDGSGNGNESSNAIRLEANGTAAEGYRKIDDVLDKGPVRGGELNLFTTKPDSFNPIYSGNSYVKDFLGLIFEGLTKLDRKQKPVPVLSDKWTVSPNGLTWNFHIRSGVKWHDGKPLTASDVEFTVNSILNIKSNSQYKALFKNVTSFSAVDSDNFKLVLSKPNSFFAELMCFPVIPKHQFQGSTADNEGTNYKPVGTGPFRFVDFEKDKAVTLEAFRSWWYVFTVEKPGELLYIDKINIKVYESSKEALNAFQTSDIDVSAIDAADIGKYYGRSDLIFKKFCSRKFEFLAFNLSGKLTGEQSVRTAISKAVNRKSIIDGLLNGGAIEAGLPVNPESWLMERITSNEPPAGSPGTILEADGWKKGEQNYYKSAGGVRKELKLELLVANGNALRIKIAEMIAEQLKASGISASVVKLDWEQLMQRITAKKYDIAVMGLRTSRTPDLSLMYANDAALPAGSGAAADSVWNIAGYNNNDVNLNLQKILTDNSDQMRKLYFENTKKIIETEMPYLGLFFLDDAVVYRKNVRGLLDPNIWDNYNDITKWYIPGG